MDPARREKLKEVFAASLARDATEREAFLDVACEGDAALRAEVESLLDASARAGTFIEVGAPGLRELAAELGAGTKDHAAGLRIGAYQLIEVIGRGGMGTVYRARRDDEQFQKEVALKLIRGDLGSETVVRRFREERQILAQLGHPNIATLHDGGTTADGQPYLVMELIEGQPLDVYCQRRALPIKERLALVRTICAAVHHAHQHLVVHRDLKPQNILVTADGVPKLLDFGIAKLLSASADPASAATATVLPVLTPAYSSPEQLLGRPVTTASDVYSLGVILYQLLAGRLPHDLAGRSHEEVMRAVCETEPLRPSAAAAPSRAASAHLAGDLDTIVLKALRKDPARRYASAQELGEDLRRCIEGLPVLARGDSLGYRARKFLQRHKAGGAAAALAIAGLVTGTILALREARLADTERARAQRRFVDVRELATTFTFEVHDAIQDLRGATKARGLIVKRSIVYLDKLAKEAAGDASLQRELAAAYLKLGDIQGRRFGANLGDTAGARKSYERAIDLGAALVAANAGDAFGRQRLAEAHNKVGEILFVTAGPRAAALSHAKALLQYEALVAASPGDPGGREGLAGTLCDLGYAKAAAGEAASGLALLQEGTRRLEALVPTPPTHHRTLDRLGQAYARVGEVLVEMAPGEGAGLEMYKKGLGVDEALARAEPTSAKFARNVVGSLLRVGQSLLELDDSPGALASYRRALALLEPLAAADPANAQHRADLGFVFRVLGEAYVKNDDPSGALPILERGRTILEPLAAADPSNLSTQAFVADLNVGLGRAHAALAISQRTAAHARAGHWREADARLRKARGSFVDLDQRGHDQRAKIADVTRLLALCEEGRSGRSAPR